MDVVSGNPQPDLTRSQWEDVATFLEWTRHSVPSWTAKTPGVDVLMVELGRHGVEPRT